MRSLDEFSSAEWARLKPLITAIRQVRNSTLYRAYCAQKSHEASVLLNSLGSRRHEDLVVAIAFERPWIIDWMLRMARQNLSGATLVIADNSRYPKERAEIAEVCARYGVPYLPLPEYRTRHVNRSHSMAMGWILANVISPLRPGIFSFIDHDLIPVSPVNLRELTGDQPVYGLHWPGHGRYWQLWAGYCTFRANCFPFERASMLYDFCRGLDTGGRLWETIYSRLDQSKLRFAKNARETLQLPSGDSAKVQMLDDRWMHFEGIGYNDNFEKKGAFFKAVAEALESGKNWHDLKAS